MSTARANGGSRRRPDSGLAVSRLTYAETVGIIIGTNIGAGILGLAYASRKAGYLPLLFWLAVTGFFTCVSMLYVAETCLRTKGDHQLSGLAERYLGKVGGWAIFLGVAANSYGALVAYIAGSGKILSSLLGAWDVNPAMGSLLFFVPAATVLYLGLKVLARGEKYISACMVAIILALISATAFHDGSDPARLLEGRWEYMLPVFNLAVFCFAAQYMVPELARGNKASPKNMARAIVSGIVGTFVLLAIVPASVVALCGLGGLSEVATINWGMALGKWAYYTANIFSLFAMLTSYWGLGTSLFTNIFDWFRLGDETVPSKRLMVLVVVGLPPFLFAYSNFAGFVDALYFAGTFGGVLIAVIPVLMFRQARKRGDIDPDWQCGWYAHKAVQTSICVLFPLSALYAVLALFGLLPAGW